MNPEVDMLLGNATWREPTRVHALLAALHRETTQPWVLMELCGGQTHAILRSGLDTLLPPGLELVHGPGCPVCVTPLSLIDDAHTLASLPGVTLASFGDMLRVPGTRGDLLSLRAQGAQVVVVYSPGDALEWAAQHPEETVVFFGVGFETTAPATAAAVCEARRRRLANFALLSAHVLVPPAMRSLLASPLCRVQGFLAAGHVCAITGLAEYELLARESGRPIVVCGFEPVDLLVALRACVRQLERGLAGVENAYGRVTAQLGNPRAQALIAEVYEPCDREWRGLGCLPQSGLALRPGYADHDASVRFASVLQQARLQPRSQQAYRERGHLPDRQAAELACISGRIMQGLARPADCPELGARCSPEQPLGAPMVSSEGACAAWYRYRRSQPERV